MQTHGDALALLLSDPRLPGVVDDIVVEFGNALYQDTIDAFIVGQPVNDADLRPVWRNTTSSPGAWDGPMYEQVYRTVRAANWAQPPGKRMRVLLGDPPIDWAKITTREEFLAFFQHRDAYFVSVVQQQVVVAKGRRALLCEGADAFFPPMAIEQQTGERVYSIVDLDFPPGDPGGLASRLSRYPRYSVIPTAGTWLGSFDAELALIGPSPGSPPVAGRPPGPPPGAPTWPRRPGRKGKPKISSDLTNNPFCGKKVGQFIDAGLYLGQPGELTASWPNPGHLPRPGVLGGTAAAQHAGRFSGPRVGCYRRWLVADRGLAPATVVRYEKLARRFLDQRARPGEPVAVADLSGADVTGFLLA